jgi:serine/threonine protein kinase
MSGNEADRDKSAMLELLNAKTHRPHRSRAATRTQLTASGHSLTFVASGRFRATLGRTISHYRIIEKTGRWRHGRAVQARRYNPASSVALKFLPDEVARDHQAPKRFSREARAASALNHPERTSGLTRLTNGKMPARITNLELMVERAEQPAKRKR